MAMRLQLVQEDRLVREDVARIAVVVVEVAKLVVEKAGRASRWDYPGCADLRDVLAAAIHSALALLNG